MRLNRPPPQAHDLEYSLAQLNVKARGVNEAGGAANINDLVDEVFNTFILTVDSSIKSRIANSENLYQTNQRGGVTEDQVVAAMNGLVHKFNTPEFTFTDLYEVRRLRQMLQLYAPQFVGHGRASVQNSNGNVSPTMVQDMSPTEAVFVLLALVLQKRSNPNFQYTVSERNAQWDQQRTTNIGQARTNDEDKNYQVEIAIQNQVNTMTTIELLDIPDRALDILGIEP